MARRGPNEVKIDGADAWLILTGRNGEEVGRCVIDAVDLPLVRQFRWHMGSGSRGGKHNRRELRYVMTNVPMNHPSATLLPRPKTDAPKNGKRTLKLHHLLGGRPPAGHVIDHVDGDRMNNRRSNLEIVTFKRNARRP